MRSSERLPLVGAIVVVVLVAGCVAGVPFASGPVTVDCEFTLDTAGSEVGPSLPASTEIASEADAVAFVEAVERHVAWHEIRMADATTTSVRVAETAADRNASGFVVRVGRVSVTSTSEDGDVADGGWSAHYFVNDSSVWRATGIAGKNASPRSDGRTICAS